MFFHWTNDPRDVLNWSLRTDFLSQIVIGILFTSELTPLTKEIFRWFQLKVWREAYGRSNLSSARTLNESYQKIGKIRIYLNVFSFTNWICFLASMFSEVFSNSEIVQPLGPGKLRKTATNLRIYLETVRSSK